MAWKRAKVPEMATEPGISLQRPSPRFWRGFWAAAILLVPIGVLVDRYTDLDLDKLTLYGAFVAAIYGGIQVYQARLDSLRPVLLGNEVQFARLPARPNAPAREEVGISLRVKNVGSGPALQGRFRGWLQRISDADGHHDPERDVDGEELKLKQGSAHFHIEIAGLGAGEEFAGAWQPTLSYEGPLDGDFWFHWHLEYRDSADRRNQTWGSSFFESGVTERIEEVRPEMADEG